MVQLFGPILSLLPTWNYGSRSGICFMAIVNCLTGVHRTECCWRGHGSVAHGSWIQSNGEGQRGVGRQQEGRSCSNGSLPLPWHPVPQDPIWNRIGLLLIFNVFPINFMELGWDPCRKCKYCTFSGFKKYNCNKPFCSSTAFLFLLCWGKKICPFPKIYSLNHNSRGSYWICFNSHMFLE